MQFWILNNARIFSTVRFSGEKLFTFDEWFLFLLSVKNILMAW